METHFEHEIYEHELDLPIRREILTKQRIVVKIGSSSLQHPETGKLDLNKMEVLVRELCNIRNSGKEVVLVTSGAISVGKNAVHVGNPNESIELKQACAAIGQSRLMMVYQKIFAEYNQVAAQVLLTKDVVTNPVSRRNAKNTLATLLELGVIPVVNENDTISTFEIKFGDNDTLSAIVASLIQADLLILLSDIDGLYTDNPRTNPNAEFIDTVDSITDEIMHMGTGDTGSNVGTGGMNTKLLAAKIATTAGADMIIANSSDIRILHRIMDGRHFGTHFKQHRDENFNLIRIMEEIEGEH
ncbi:MAG: glutamate 5-kinase [Lachnospiraceae bacterium]|nr:glutamate 5-kinase [Lachnospiraceae bacterium]